MASRPASTRSRQTHRPVPYTIQANYSGSPNLAPSTDALHSLIVSGPSVTVTAVGVRWNLDSASLKDAPDGIRLLPAGRTNDLPWFNIDRIVITLSQAVTLSPADVTVHGVKGNYGPVTLSGVGSTTVTITLAKSVAAADLLTLTIGNDHIITYKRRIDILPGDVNDDRVVNTTDGVLVLNQTTPAHTYNLNNDMNGDGVVTTADFTLYRPAIGSTLPAPPPQLVAGGEGPGAPPISVKALVPILDEAIAAWAASGISPRDLARLRTVGVQLADLPAGYLGATAIGGTTIEISPDADGYGWSVDPSVQSGREDLLTVIAHELGHTLGLGDLDPAVVPY